MRWHTSKTHLSLGNDSIGINISIRNFFLKVLFNGTGVWWLHEKICLAHNDTYFIYLFQIRRKDSPFPGLVNARTKIADSQIWYLRIDKQIWYHRWAPDRTTMWHITITKRLNIKCQSKVLKILNHSSYHHAEYLQNIYSLYTSNQEAQL